MPPPGREVQAERLGTLLADRVRCKPYTARLCGEWSQEGAGPSYVVMEKWNAIRDRPSRS